MNKICSIHRWNEALDGGDACPKCHPPSTENNIAGGRTHTPGPWQVDGSSIIRIDPDFCIAVIEDVRGYEAPAEQQKSNARLIAAAPDLLEAAKGALKVLNPATAGVFYENLKAAISKAESR